MIEIYGKDQCPQCDMAKNIANSRGIQFNYKQLGTDFTREELFEQFPNARTMPQVKKLDGGVIGGFKEFGQWAKSEFLELD